MSGGSNETYDVAVIGAGIVGVSTALHLLMRGKKVVLIDRRGAGEETSYGNAGFIETSLVLPYAFPKLSRIPNILLDRDTMARVRYRDLPRTLPWVLKFFLESFPERRRENGRLMRPLVEPSLEEHKALMRSTSAENYLRTTGRVALYHTEASFAAGAVERETAKEMGVPFEIMGPEKFGKQEPHLKPVYHKVVRWSGSARLTNPGAVVTAYAERFTREGGTFLKKTAKGLFATADKWKIETDTGALQARHVVVCAGPWANDILKPLGYRFPLGFKRGYHQHFSAPAGMSLAHGFSVVEYGFVLAPMEQGYRITTGAEFAARDAPPNPSQIARLLPHARELFPLGGPVEAKAWMGSRPCFTDSLPLIGPAPRHKNLWFNIGHGHMGMTMGPATGRLLAEMMCGGKTFCDPHPYRAERFSA